MNERIPTPYEELRDVVMRTSATLDALARTHPSVRKSQGRPKGRDRAAALDELDPLVPTQMQCLACELRAAWDAYAGALATGGGGVVGPRYSEAEVAAAVTQASAILGSVQAKMRDAAKEGTT